MDVDYLREALREDAQLAGAPEPDLYEQVRARRQRADRRRLGSLAAGLATVMAVVAVPIGVSLLGSAEDRVVAPPSVPQADIFGVPARGSLASDASFLEELVQLSWATPDLELDPGSDQPPIPDPPVETRHVAFAGEVPSGRWALVVGPNTTQPVGEAADPELQTDLGPLSPIAGVWFVGPPEAKPDQMQMATVPRGLLPDQPASLHNGTTGALVVVAAPGDVIEISPRPEVSADATMTRTYDDAGVTDGVVVTAAEPNPYSYMPAVQFRVSRAGVVVAEQTPDGYSDPFATGIVPDIELEYLRPPVDRLPPDDPSSDEQRIAAEILSEYGLRSDQVNLQVHYVGPVPGSAEAPATLTVLTATFPSGAVLTRALWKEQIASAQGPYSGVVIGGGECANDLSAAGAPAAQRIIAIRCDVRAGVSDSQLPSPVSTLVVLTPPGLGASSMVVEGNPGGSTIALSDQGLAIVAFPDGAETVLIQAADGTPLDEVPIIAP